MHLNTNSLILAGVVAHLLAALAKTVLKAPKQQAQIDAIEGKVDTVLGQVQTVQQVLASTSSPAAAAGASAPSSATDGGSS